MRLYNGTLIVPALILFLVVVTFPLWLGAVRPREARPFASRSAPPGVTCVLPKIQMRERHMNLLKQWREEVVRESNRSPITLAGGATMERSLTNGCMKCHARQDCGPYRALATYCVDCHDYVGIKINCWTCHIDPAPQLLENK